MVAGLHIEQGQGTPPFCELVHGQVVTLGRHSNNTVVLRDTHASRWHAIVFSEADRWYISNVGVPLNQTTVNGQVVDQQTELLDSSDIAIGHTRLRFTVKGEIAPAAKTAVGRQEPDLLTTPLQPDELALLCTFLSHSVDATDPRLLIRYAMETLAQHTEATKVGFLSLDIREPLPKVVWPDQAEVDIHLSRQLTQMVESQSRAVWLGAGTVNDPLSDSLGQVRDAICIPLRVSGAALGAVHLYHATSKFTRRHLHFCEVLANSLALSLNHLLGSRILQAENHRLRKQRLAADELIGSSLSMKNLRQTIARAAPCSSTVLIHGETGVGKELVALALHRQSRRQKGPLVVVNCAAITATLHEAELFGHCKGAFTGAIRDRAGFFAQADDGTLFLDEVGELPLDCQAKVLRVIEGQSFRPVGATSEIRVDVRIIAATNRDLEEEVRKGTFRRDLLFRLQVIQISVPPLREHASDLSLIAASFLKRVAEERGHPPAHLTYEAIERLKRYSWPGNVRQLLAVLESAVAMRDGPQLDAADFVLPTDAAAHPAGTLKLGELERWAIGLALDQTKGNISKAAETLGIARDTLARKIKREGIGKPKAR